MASATSQAVISHQAESHQRPNLLNIPREVRDMIIAPFLQSGDLIILCICPSITEEALQRIKHEATFRVNFNIEGCKDTVLEKAKIPEDIGNVEIRFNLPFARDNELKDAFRSSSMQHLGYPHYGIMDRCIITVNYDQYKTLRAANDRQQIRRFKSRKSKLPYTLLYTLSGYTHFNTIIIKIGGGTRGTSYWNLLDVDALENDLMPALGPAIISNDVGNGSLEFHPREYTLGKHGLSDNGQAVPT